MQNSQEDKDSECNAKMTQSYNLNASEKLTNDSDTSLIYLKASEESACKNINDQQDNNCIRNLNLAAIPAQAPQHNNCANKDNNNNPTYYFSSNYFLNIPKNLNMNLYSINNKKYYYYYQNMCCLNQVKNMANGISTQNTMQNGFEIRSQNIQHSETGNNLQGLSSHTGSFFRSSSDSLQDNKKYILNKQYKNPLKDPKHIEKFKIHAQGMSNFDLFCEGISIKLPNKEAYINNISLAAFFEQFSKLSCMGLDILYLLKGVNFFLNFIEIFLYKKLFVYQLNH